MGIISTISVTIVVIFIGIIALAIFIQTNVELWNEVGKDLWDDFTGWLKKTKAGMWYNNRKNGIDILSDREYDRIVRTKGIKVIEIV